MTHFRLLESGQKAAAARMTFPFYRHLLQRHPERVAAVQAELFGRPLGLGLVRLPGEAGPEDPLAGEDSGRQAELLSLWVDGPARKQGLAAEMLRRLEGAAWEAGCDSMKAAYLLGKPSIPIVEHLLDRAGWDAPNTRGYMIRFTRDQARQTPWFGKYELGEGYETFPWRDLSEAERQALQASQERDGWIPEDLEPWKFDGTAEPITSLGLKLDGEIVGWVINQVISPEMVRITCAFVRRDLQRLGKILPLFSESLDLLQQTPYVHVSGVSLNNYRPIIAFYKRWCGPWADHLGEARECLKRLDGAAEVS